MVVREHVDDACPTQRMNQSTRRPVRTCVGCRQRAAKQELLRVVASGTGKGLALQPDPRGVAPGRGAHLHPTLECLELALRRRAFPRALRVKDGLADTEVRDYLQRMTEQ